MNNSKHFLTLSILKCVYSFCSSQALIFGTLAHALLACKRIFMLFFFCIYTFTNLGLLVSSVYIITWPKTNQFQPLLRVSILQNFNDNKFQKLLWIFIKHHNKNGYNILDSGLNNVWVDPLSQCEHCLSCAQHTVQLYVTQWSLNQCEGCYIYRLCMASLM